MHYGPETGLKAFIMSKKEKDPENEYQKLKNEIMRDRVAEVFQRNTADYISALEEIGFTYYDDEDPEEIEEAQARPENQDQQDLVDFFNSGFEPSETTLEIFLRVKDAAEPNLPLVRKYFKRGNSNLKRLITYGLDHYPARVDLLYDLAYFHEFSNVLSDLIKYFTRACVNEGNPETFAELARDFDDLALPDGYEALYALRDIFGPDTDKRDIIEFLIQEADKPQDDSGIEF